jgi:penicillin-binding protein 1A
MSSKRPARGRPRRPPARRPSNRAGSRPPARRSAGRRHGPNGDARPQRRRWYRRPVALLLVLPALLLAFAGLTLFFYFFASIPLPDAIGQDATVVLDHGGNEIATLQPQESRADVELHALPEHVPHALLAAEDAQFYSHPGFSMAGIFRAAFVNVAAGQVRQGGSTISQQYIKNVTADTSRTNLRKVREAALAVKLEREFSKDEILEFYLNSVYFGRGAYGIQAAARAFYGVNATDLDAGQAAQLFGVLPAPSSLDPADNPEGAERRYRYVLGQMVRHGWLDAAEGGRLAASPPPVQPKRAVQFRRAPFFLDLVQRELEARIGGEQMYRGLRVTTTLNLGVQGAAEAAYNEGFASIEPHGALVALDPGSGGIRALVGGKNYAEDQLNLATVGRQAGTTGRQPGSTFKPFALAAWIEQGKSPESYFSAPGEITFSAEEARTPQAWRVRNYGGSEYGQMSLREATWRSVNTVYAQLMLEVGPEATVDLAKRAGIDADLPPLPSLVLGTGEVSPLELAEAFNTFATGGIQREPFTILEIERDGSTIYRAQRDESRAFSEQVAYTVTDVLKGVLASGTGTGANIDRPAAGKTGTTQNFADAWFVGYTPHLTAAVWMGHRDGNQPMADNPTGGGVPAQVWARFMSTALQSVPPEDFPAPSGDLDVVNPSPPPEPEPECPEGQVEVDREVDEDGNVSLVCEAEEPEPEPECPEGQVEIERLVDEDGNVSLVCVEPEDEPEPEPTEEPTVEPEPSPEPEPEPSPDDGGTTEESSNGGAPGGEDDDP